jgi:signal transduction histidine kinase
VKVFRADSKAVLQVSDNGIGIPTRDLPHIFERFYRVDKARSRDLGGAGLGLSIVQSICNAHGGKIEVQSAEKKGSCFSVRLPLAGADAPAKL